MEEGRTTSISLDPLGPSPPHPGRMTGFQGSSCLKTAAISCRHLQLYAVPGLGVGWGHTALQGQFPSCGQNSILGCHYEGHLTSASSALSTQQLIQTRKGSLLITLGQHCCESFSCPLGASPRDWPAAARALCAVQLGESPTSFPGSPLNQDC